MKKRLMPTLLALFLTLTLLPVQALAMTVEGNPAPTLEEEMPEAEPMPELQPEPETTGGVNLLADSVTSGNCGADGDNLTWTLDSNGTLTISGSGKMMDYGDSSTRPWDSQRSTIKKVVISDGVTTIGDTAFWSCNNLISVTIPYGVTSIKSSAFGGCSSLTGLIIPESVISIGRYAFSGCWKLTSLTIPTGITRIERYTFRDCHKLNVIIPDGVVFIGSYAFEYCNGLTNVALPASVTTIEPYAFTNCNGLTGVSIPSSVTRIEDYAFTGCRRLTSVTISEGVKAIGEEAFSWCPNLTSVTIPESVVSIGRGAFSSCASLTSAGPISGQYNIRFGWKTQIPSRALQECRSLTSVTIPFGITRINEWAFYDCSGLTSVSIPSSVTKIEQGVFGGDCSNLKDVYYAGTKTQWEAVEKRIWNNILNVVNIHYSKTDPNREPQNIPVHSGNTNEVLDASLSQVDLTALFENVTCDMNKLRGPKISIAGLDFYLFEFESKLELPFEKVIVQVSVDYEKKTVNLLLGYKPIKGTTTIVGDSNSVEDSRNDFWKSYTDAKDLNRLITGKTSNSASFRSKFQDVYDELQELGMDLIVKAEGKVCGYAEFSYEKGELELSEGGGLLAVSVKTTKNGRIPSFPAAYCTLRFEVSAEGKIRMVADEDSWRFDPAFDAALKTAIGVGLGKNTGKFQAYIEGGFDGELGAHVRPMWKVTKENLLSVDMTGKLYFSWKLKAWVLETGDIYKKQLFKFGLYPRLELLSEGSSSPITMNEFLASARPVTRDYLYAPALMSVTDDYSFSKVEYPYAEPTLLRLLDGQMLMVWVGDSGQKVDADRTSIFYSIYNGTWSTPAPVFESRTYADHPVLYQDGETVYAVWMQADMTLENMEAQEAFHHLDLMFASFDGNAWSIPAKISSDNALTETDYTLAAKNGTVAVAWIENSENDMLMGSGTNTVYLRTCINGAWNEISTIYSTESPITGLDVDLNTNLQMSWAVSSGETTTAYVRDASGDLQSSAGGDQDARWINGSRYELHNTELYRDGVATGLSGLTNFEIVSSGMQTVVLTLIPTGFTCELYGSYYDAGSRKWGPLVQLTGYNKYIRSYSAVLDESGKLVAALNLVNVNSEADEVYNNTNAQLVVVDDCRYTDLVVDDWISYDDDLVISGGTLPLSFQVTNNSMETLTSVTADANGQTQIISCSLPAGESAILTMNYALPSSLSEHEVRLAITPYYTAAESNTANNVASVKIGVADLEAVISEPEASIGGASVNIEVANKGYAAAENVYLKVYRSNLEGEVLCEQSLGQIAANKTTQHTFQLPTDLLFLDDPETLNALSCEVISDAEERELVNNGDRIVFGNLLPLQVSASADTNTVKFHVSVGSMESDASDGAVMLALYNTDEKMLAVRIGSLSLAAGGHKDIEFVISSNQYPDAAQAKVFWVDAESHTPITPAWQGIYPKA